MKYVAPIASVEVLNNEDVLLASNVKVSSEDGSLKVVNWNDFA